MILRPTFTVRWIAPVLFLAGAGASLVGVYQQVTSGQFGGVAIFLGAFALVLIGAAVFVRTAYIEVDDSRIIFGPRILHRTFNRRDVARIRTVAFSPSSRRTLLLRADGSTLWSLPGSFWGRAGLQSLADYLGVPFEGWA